MIQNNGQKMKKSKTVQLVLLGAAWVAAQQASAQSKGAEGSWDTKGEKKVYMRADTTAGYTRTHHHYGGGVGNALLYYYAFRPYGRYYGNTYRRTGYYGGGLSHSSNVGRSSFKSGVTRGGFGRSGFHVSS
jgi:hypothetical protein